MVYRLIGNIRVSMTKKGYKTVTNGRHPLVTPELLARKWGIAFEKAKDMLKEKNSGLYFSALLALTRR